MTAKDIGGIASRVVSIYMAVQAIEYGSMTAFLLQPSMRYATRRPVPPWPNYAVPAAMFVIGAVLFWALSNRFWPGESESEADVNLDQLKHIAFSLLGAYLLIDYGAAAIIELITRMQDLTPRASPNSRFTAEMLVALLGLCLLVVNSRKEAGPDFDQLRGK